MYTIIRENPDTMIIKKKDLKEILFIDIETVSEVAHLSELSTEKQALWGKKSRKFTQTAEDLNEHYASMYEDKAGIFAEFAKVICITVGYLKKKKGEEYRLRVKTFGGHDERQVLESFCDLLDRHFDDPAQYFLCGHNIKEFDVPFLCRRMVIHGLSLPRLLNIAGKKPWQVPHLLDTMDLWRFGDYKNYTSLALLAATLGVPSPKDDIDGSQVGAVYWKEDDLDRIIRYCEKDMVTVVQVAMRFSGSELIEDSQIEYAESK